VEKGRGGRGKKCSVPGPCMSHEGSPVRKRGKYRRGGVEKNQKSDSSTLPRRPKKGASGKRKIGLQKNRLVSVMPSKGREVGGRLNGVSGSLSGRE